MESTNKLKRQNRRTLRARKKILGSKAHPRLSVFRSNKHIYAQIIDDVKGVTLASVSEKELESGANKTVRAQEIGKMIAEKAKKAKVSQVVFDRGSYRYHGRVKALAEGAREGGLNF